MLHLPVESSEMGTFGVAARCDLYRAYAPGGVLLYVGISHDALARIAQHRRESAWFPDCIRVTITRFPSRAMAVSAEHEAIRAERPIFNVCNNGHGVKPCPGDPGFVAWATRRLASAGGR